MYQNVLISRVIVAKATFYDLNATWRRDMPFIKTSCVILTNYHVVTFTNDIRQYFEDYMGARDQIEELIGPWEMRM